MKNITVLSGEIPIDEITSALLEEGIVVLQTVRHHARLLADKAASILNNTIDNEDAQSLLHLSVEVKDHGWSDFFVYPPIAEYQPGETQRIVRNAISNWEAHGSPDKYITVVT